MTDGLPHYERALRISRELSGAHPESRDHALELVKRLVALGNIRRHEGVPLEARPLFAEAKLIVDRLLGPAPGEPTLKTWLAVVLDNEANTMMDQDQAEKARPLLERAAALFRQKPTVQHPPARSASSGRHEAKSSGTSPVSCAHSSSPQRQAESMRNESVCGAPAHRTNWSTLALKETSRAVLIGYGRTDVSERGKAVRELDLDQAADNLQLAIVRGFKDLNRLKAHPDAPFLLSRDDVKSAIAGLESSEPPTGSQTSNKAGKP